MNTSTLRHDLADYLALVWSAKWWIALATAGSVVVMVLLTAALPRLYMLRAEIDTGPLHQATPVELNRLVEAIDRDLYEVEGGRFGSTLTDSLTASFRAPSTLVLIARSDKPEDAYARFNVLIASVRADLQKRLLRAAAVRAQVEKRTTAAQNDVNRRAQRLARLFQERTAFAARVKAEGEADATSAAARRATLQASVQERFRQPLIQLRERLVAPRAPDAPAVDPEALEAIDALLAELVPDADPKRPESVFEALERLDVRRSLVAAIAASQEPALTALPAAFQEIAALDLEVVRAGEAQRSAEQLRQRDERAVALLVGRKPVAHTEGAAEFKAELVELQTHYEAVADPPTARAIRQTAVSVAALVERYGELAKEQEGPPLVQEPEVRVAPMTPSEPVWPRPMVNIVIAALFGFVASVIVVVFADSRRALTS